jgi:hypothetical protein
VEVDGNLLPPNIVNKLNIFMVNVLRFKGNTDLSGLIDPAGSHNPRFGEALPGNRIAAGPVGEEPEGEDLREPAALVAGGEGDGDN